MYRVSHVLERVVRRQVEESVHLVATFLLLLR